MEFKEMQKLIRKREYLFSEHADEERLKDQLTVQDVEEAILSGKIIEERPEDDRGETMNTCYTCSGKLKKEKINIARYWGDELIALQDVPAMTCQQCGERYFEAKVSAGIDKKIQQALQKKNIVNELVVPVLQF